MKLFACLLALLSTSAIAQDLTYPELQVTPRASKRIQIEVKEEAGRAWSSHMAVQLSALSTLAAGSLAGSSIDTENNKDEKEVSPKVAMGVGLAWLGASTWAALSYRPYKAALLKLKKMPYKTKRQKLTVERLAEEEIRSLKVLGQRVRWFSAVSNLAASAFVLDSVKSESNAAYAASVSALMSLGPIFFKYHWEDVANEQEKYKKKIYSPVAMTPILVNPFNVTQRASGVNLLFTF